MPELPPSLSEAQTARAVFRAGPFGMRFSARATPAGLLAAGALVSGILLSSAVITWAARRRS